MPTERSNKARQNSGFPKLNFAFPTGFSPVDIPELAKRESARQSIAVAPVDADPENNYITFHIFEILPGNAQNMAELKDQVSVEQPNALVTELTMDGREGLQIDDPDKPSIRDYYFFLSDRAALAIYCRWSDEDQEIQIIDAANEIIEDMTIS